MLTYEAKCVWYIRPRFRRSFRPEFPLKAPTSMFIVIFRAFTSVLLNFLSILHEKTYFFYFTHPLLQITHISLSILHIYLLKYSLFYQFLLFTPSLPLFLTNPQPPSPLSSETKQKSDQPTHTDQPTQKIIRNQRKIWSTNTYRSTQMKNQIQHHIN